MSTYDNRNVIDGILAITKDFNMGLFYKNYHRLVHTIIIRGCQVIIPDTPASFPNLGEINVINGSLIIRDLALQGNPVKKIYICNSRVYFGKSCCFGSMVEDLTFNMASKVIFSESSFSNCQFKELQLDLENIVNDSIIIPRKCFAHNIDLKTFKGSGNFKLASGSFYGCSNLQSVYIQKDGMLNTIADQAHKLNKMKDLVESLAPYSGEPLLSELEYIAACDPSLGHKLQHNLKEAIITKEKLSKSQTGDKLNKFSSASSMKLF